tara:strand:+ start:168 stop:521 length:354 start_codon:yes stop_codon:yes gene_type:complete
VNLYEWYSQKKSKQLDKRLESMRLKLLNDLNDNFIGEPIDNSTRAKIVMMVKEHIKEVVPEGYMEGIQIDSHLVSLGRPDILSVQVRVTSLVDALSFSFEVTNPDAINYEIGGSSNA